MLNPGHGCFNVDTKVAWYDDHKKQLIQEFAHTYHNDPRVRKLTELASDAVFPGTHLTHHWEEKETQAEADKERASDKQEEAQLNEEHAEESNHSPDVAKKSSEEPVLAEVAPSQEQKINQEENKSGKKEK